MRFGLTDEQTALRDTARAFFSANAGRDELRRVIQPDAEHDPRLWARMSEEMGLTGLTVDIEQDGAGAGFVELAVVLEESGRVLLSAPLFSTAVLAVSALQQSGDPAAQDEWLPRLATGGLQATLAYLDDDAETRAARNGAGWTVHGRKSYVIDGDTAGLVLVTAETDAGLSLFAVHGDASGCDRVRLDALDPTRHLADLSFDGVEAQLIGDEGAGAVVLRRTLDIAAVALAAEMVGVAQSALDMAVAYASTRVQFDRPIGSFQAIKHKCADMFIDVETSRALVMHAAWAVSHGTASLSEVASMTIAHASDACFRVVAQNLQILGGIGYTWEHDGHLYFKRGKSSSQLLGSSDSHRELVASAVGL
jgi:alkylation response protein AidB-like acyl-CoA dehydrogenase